MAQLPSLDDLLQEVPPAALKRPCTDEHLRNLALSIVDWKALAPFLELDEVDESMIEEKSTSPLRRRIAVLRKWQEKCALRGRTASYKKLAKVFWKLGRADLVEKVGRAAAEERVSSSSDDEETGPKSSQVQNTLEPGFATSRLDVTPSPQVPLTPAYMVEIYDVLTESGFRPSSWQALAPRLGITDPASIQMEFRETSLCLQKTIRQWLHHDTQASWQKLAHQVSRIDGYGPVTELAILRNARVHA